MVRGDVKERFVAEHEVEHHPRRRRAEDDGTEDRRMHVAHDFLEREKHGGDWGVERGGKSSRGPYRDQPADLRRAQAEPARDDGGNARSDVYRRALASKCDAARQRRRAAEELAEDGAQRDVAVVDEDGGARLWNAAAAGLGKEPKEEISRAERAERRNDDAPGRGAARRKHARRQTARQQNERDDDESNERADEKAEGEG